MACGRLCGRLIGDNATAARLESVNVETGENFVFLVSMLADSAGSRLIATGGTVKVNPWGDYDTPQGVQCSSFG